MPWLFLSRAIIIKPTEKPRTPSKAKFAVKIRLWEHCKQIGTILSARGFSARGLELVPLNSQPMMHIMERESMWHYGIAVDPGLLGNVTQWRDSANKQSL